MAELPPGSVLLTDYPDRIGRTRYALSPDGRVWRIIHGGGLKKTTELPRPIKPVFMGTKGSRSPFYKLEMRDKRGYLKPTSLMSLMKKHFPEASKDR